MSMYIILDFYVTVITTKFISYNKIQMDVWITEPMISEEGHQTRETRVKGSGTSCLREN